MCAFSGGGSSYSSFDVQFLFTEYKVDASKGGLDNNQKATSQGKF